MKKTESVLNPQTIKRLRLIQKDILSEPRQFDMGHFFTKSPTNVEKVPHCKTAACIAGWAVTHARKINPRSAMDIFGDSGACQDPAAQFLGITEYQSEMLFFSSNWPSDYAAAYDACEFSPELRARVSVERIEHFIRTGE